MGQRPEAPRREGQHPRLRAVLLDIDDTLVDTRAAFRAAIAQVLGEWIPHLDADAREAATLHWVHDPGGHFRAYTRGEHDFGTQRRLRARDLHLAFGGPPLEGPDYLRWECRYEAAFRAAWTLAPDALGLLDRLARARLAVGAVTNLERSYQRDKLEAVGLGERLEVLVGIDDLGFGKPDRRVFALACRRLGVGPDQVAYVGDEVDVDARAARDAGLLGVWLDRHGTGEDPGDGPVVRTLA
jgi:putative hydrolase of the HAD superfamily